MSAEKAKDAILFRVPDNLPCYGDWDFEVFPGLFALYAESLCVELERLIERDRPGWLTRWLFRNTWCSVEREERVGLLRKLRDEHADRDGLAREYQNTIWILARAAIYSRDFLYYVCPKCDRRYAPEEGNTQSWCNGQGLAAWGGHRLECPEGHALYATTEWNS